MLFLIITWGLTCAGAVIGLLRPFQGLLFYICLSILRPQGLWAGSVPPGVYTRIVAIGVLVGWLLKRARLMAFSAQRVDRCEFSGLLGLDGDLCVPGDRPGPGVVYRRRTIEGPASGGGGPDPCRIAAAGSCNWRGS